ncbi:histidine phosphatase family protein [Nitrosovibrio sp. Nv17]|jgi:phosphohistidine phosphatase|uniref:SixA phosphatase family protein n=1 Tax=Nitrosovibrio sp. Nv17 TaxID=1855339 RepID=UPI000908961E|nr:histidine phosphatase family protein [Nitrosovibrio sp. Nv17]SFW33222.1 phosphohistidine phosphatase, SixA [Nitrosovibrio sp. Nv17]
MELILWRHAEAEEGVPDITRRLTDRGLKQARAMAGWLNPRLPKNVHIIVSPATRTQQTAAALGCDFETVKALAPGASADAVLDAAGWPNAEEAVVVVGHQPTLGEVISLVMSGEESRGCSVRKGAVWWLSSRKREGAASVVLRASIAPDML